MTTPEIDVRADPVKVKQVSLEMTVIRADGRREEKGVVARSRPTTLKEWWRWVVRRENGMAVLQVNVGRAIVTGRLRSVGTEPLNAGWGTGAGTTAAADTTLFTEVLVNMTGGGTDHTVGTSSQVTTTTTNDTYQVVATRTATASGTITNMGLFDAASGGTLFVKGDFAGVALANGDSIQATFKVQYT